MKLENINVNVKLDLSDDMRIIARTIIHYGENLMSTVRDFVSQQTKYNDQMEKSLSDLADDIANLNSQLADLKASGGAAVSQEDQDSLAALEQRGQSIADKLDALNQLTPPKAPANLPAEQQASAPGSDQTGAPGNAAASASGTPATPDTSANAQAGNPSNTNKNA